MIYLQTDTSGQELLLTLEDALLLFGSVTPLQYSHYLLCLTNETTNQVLYQIPVVVSENERITTLIVDTTTLTASGRHRYEVYAQNSSTNLNPTDPSVVGLIHKGWGELLNDVEYYNAPPMSIPPDMIIPIL
jgi:hypothetical protein